MFPSFTRKMSYRFQFIHIIVRKICNFIRTNFVLRQVNYIELHRNFGTRNLRIQNMEFNSIINIGTGIRGIGEENSRVRERFLRNTIRLIDEVEISVPSIFCFKL